MATRRRRPTALRQYRFKIEAYSPETMPLMRLTEYLRDLAYLFGNNDSVHLVKVEKGSTAPLLLVQKEAETKVRERLQLVEQQDGPPEAMRAMRQINERLREDDARGSLIDPDRKKILAFPGRDLNKLLEYGPIKQQGTVEGIPIRIGGEQRLVPVHLDDHGDVHICLATRALAKQIARHLFTSVIRVDGTGKWLRRRDGEWEMEYFTVNGFTPLDDVTLRGSIETLRAIPAQWKERDDPLGELMSIRHGT